MIYDNRAFEVIKVEQKDGNYWLGGYVFQKILQVGDQLIIGNQTMTQFCLLVIKDIIFYSHHIQNIDRGMSCWLIVHVESDCEIDFTQISYLYKSTEPDIFLFPEAIDLNAGYVFRASAIRFWDGIYTVRGFVIHPVKIGDKLMLRREPQQDSLIFVVKDINRYIQHQKYHYTEIQSDILCTLLADPIGQIPNNAFEDYNQFLYKVES
jgi:hypothetical protein